MKKITLIIIICFSFVFQGFSQFDSVVYTPDFKFNDGIFLTIEQMKNNTPIPFSKISKEDVTNNDFLEKLSEKETIGIPEDLGVKTVEMKTIWGVAWRGIFYINYNSELNRVPVIGSICHFIANKTVYENNNPFYYDSYYNSPYMYPPTGTTSTELRQYLIDFKTTKIVEYTMENLEEIFKRDSTIYNEFHALKKRKKEQQRFLYLRKYNLAHPIYFQQEK